MGTKESRKKVSDICGKLPEPKEFEKEYYGAYLFSLGKKMLENIRFNPNLVSILMGVGKYA